MKVSKSVTAMLGSNTESTAGVFSFFSKFSSFLSSVDSLVVPFVPCRFLDPFISVHSKKEYIPYVRMYN